MSNKILIADPDHELCEQITTLMNHEGVEVISAHDGPSALKLALNQTFACIILEIMLPKTNGLEVLQKIRQIKEVPIIILTARKASIDKQLSFDYGADDFITKPCDPKELQGRIHAVTRRAKYLMIDRPIIDFGPIKLNTATRTVKYSGAELELTKAEFNILEMLIKSPGQAYSKEELTELALGRAFTAYDRSIDVHISNLRNKLGQTPDGDDWIKTVRGFGYMINNEGLSK